MEFSSRNRNRNIPPRRPILRAISLGCCFLVLHHNITHEKLLFGEPRTGLWIFFLRFCFVWNSCTVQERQRAGERSCKKFQPCLGSDLLHFRVDNKKTRWRWRRRKRLESHVNVVEPLKVCLEIKWFSFWFFTHNNRGERDRTKEGGLEVFIFLFFKLLLIFFVSSIALSCMASFEGIFDNFSWLFLSNSLARSEIDSN